MGELTANEINIALLTLGGLLLIGGVITPTDPVISTSVVTGKVAKENLPQRIRDALSAESAANDGLAYLFVMLPILMLTRPPGEAFLHWLTKTLLWEVEAAIGLGAMMGYVAGKLLVWAERNGLTAVPFAKHYAQKTGFQGESS